MLDLMQSWIQNLDLNKNHCGSATLPVVDHPPGGRAEGPGALLTLDVLERAVVGRQGGVTLKYVVAELAGPVGKGDVRIHGRYQGNVISDVGSRSVGIRRIRIRMEACECGSCV